MPGTALPESFPIFHSSVLLSFTSALGKEEEKGKEKKEKEKEKEKEEKGEEKGWRRRDGGEGGEGMEEKGE